ncbi:MAG: DUF1841 family protein [Proteobacteria bacterium]|nr:DUF1841 family protein [Pseudomonadota bacterium]
MAFFAGEGREQMRRRYLEAWRKFGAQEPLEPLERQLAAVIAEHPEYIAWLESGDPLQAEFTPEGGRANPFLHMGLHLAIREQVGTDRPAGIAQIHRALAARAGGAHEAEHRMIEPLAEALWEAQRSGRAPDELAYLERLRRL